MTGTQQDSPSPPATLAGVRAFWEGNPLYAGEAGHAAGTASFFAAHDRVTMAEHSGRLHPIFLRDLRPGSDVLDAGCGIGFWVVQFARLGVRMTACDLTETACVLTRKRAAIEGLPASVTVGNAEALPFADASFTHVNCQGVVHHTPDMPGCLAEFHRVLRPEGTLCFSVYFRTLPLRSRTLYRLVASTAGRLMALEGRGRESMFGAAEPEDFVRMYDGAANPIGRAYSRAELHEAVRGHFAILEEIRFGFPRRILPLALPDWLHRILSRAFGLMIVLRCRRLPDRSPKGND
jgi:SAM-dependent methyltransferase